MTRARDGIIEAKVLEIVEKKALLADHEANPPAEGEPDLPPRMSENKASARD